MHKAAGLADYFSGIDLVKLNSAVTGRVLNVYGQSYGQRLFHGPAVAGYAVLNWALYAAVCVGCSLASGSSGLRQHSFRSCCGDLFMRKCY